MALFSWTSKESTPTKDKQGNWFFPVGSIGDSFDKIKLLEAYTQVPEVAAVIDWRANAKKNVRLHVVNKETMKDATSPRANEIRSLLMNPNWFQSLDEIITQSSLFHDIFGNEYLYFFNPVGMRKPKAWFTLPPTNVKIEMKDYLNSTEQIFTYQPPEFKYRLEIFNRIKDIDSSDVLHLNDRRIAATTQEQYLTGQSKLVSLTPAINNIYAAYNARGTNLRNLGALGIISSEEKDANGNVPATPEDKEELQGQFKKYGAMSNQWKFIFSKKPVKYSQISTDLFKLKTFEEVEEDFYKICDAYGIKKDNFSSSKGSTYNNVTEAEKGAYQNTIIPEMNEKVDGLNKYFGLQDERFHIISTWDHMPFFAEDLKDRSDYVSKMTSALSQAFSDGAITMDQYQEELKKIYKWR